MRNKIFSIVVVSSLLLSGCTQFLGYRPSSHLAYPNANVTPIGPAKASDTSCRVFLPVFVTASLQEEVFSEAIKSRGGDMLINYAEFLTSWVIPIPYVQIYCIKYTVEGTVAKQQIGKQKLR